MIECFVSADGYYIRGEKLNIARKLAPATSNGQPLLDQLQHIYAVMYAALSDLRGISGSRVFVYNDSRIIDDLSGHKPLDDWYTEVRTMIRQRLIPEISGVVFFKKKSAREIQEIIDAGMEELNVDDSAKNKKLLRLINDSIEQHRMAVRSKAALLRRKWFDAETQ